MIPTILIRLGFAIACLAFDLATIQRNVSSPNRGRKDERAARPPCFHPSSFFPHPPSQHAFNNKSTTKNINTPPPNNHVITPASAIFPKPIARFLPLVRIEGSKPSQFFSYAIRLSCFRTCLTRKHNHRKDHSKPPQFHSGSSVPSMAAK